MTATGPDRTTERAHCVVVGGGVVGCAVTWQLAMRGHEPILIERAHDVGEGASKANSAIVHTGFDARPGSVEADFLARARSLWPALVEHLALPYLRLGALMLAATPADLARLEAQVMPRALELGVPVAILDRTELAAQAPWVSPATAGALLVPDEAVVDPFWLTRAYAESAISEGARIRLGVAVVGLEIGRTCIEVRLSDGSAIAADQVINCAGLEADEIAGMLGDHDFSISPRKGQFLVSEEAFGVDRIVLPIPGPMGKGMLVTPIVFGGLLLGPTAVDQRDKTDRATDGPTREAILRACRELVPALAAAEPVRQFAGLRTVSSTGDYILRASRRSDRLYHVAGIRSTGISTSPAVAEAVTDDVERLRGWRSASRLGRASASAPLVLGDESGEVACICRSIGWSEVAAAFAGALPPTTLDGLKRRCGVAFGDCQGNLCTVDAALSLARASEAPITSITRNGPGSWLFAAHLEPAARYPARAAEAGNDAPPGRHDVVVIGAGFAGIGAALAMAAAGGRSLVLDRREEPGGALVAAGARLETAEHEALASFAAARDAATITFLPRTTVVGLERTDAGWRVLAAQRDQAVDVQATAVMLASGGYVQPREHLGVHGPRLSGVVTADLVHAALDAGLVPGRCAALVGAGRLADATVRRLVEAGCAVVLVSDSLPDAIRGDGRLQWIRIGGSWREVDTLVLCQRLLPGPFLLRGLGLVDGRPGQVAPADADGRVADRLWAVGSCARPDIDHRSSLADGHRVGALVAVAAVGTAA